MEGGPVGRILLVDVDPPYLGVFSAWCRRSGSELLRSVEEVSAALEPGSVGLCVIAVRGPDESGHAKVRNALKALRGCPVVVLVEETGIALALRIYQLGVADVVEIPMALEEVMANCFRHFAPFGETPQGQEFIAQSRAMEELRDGIRLAAKVDSTVLLQGETGTGKGLVARLIHEGSSRSSGPFVHVDCSALSPTLIESELFGHERGAFTGAAGQRQGRFEVANDGTIFLDEIGDLEAPLQAKLLRVLEDRVYERVGGVRTLRMQARVITATHRDLLQAVRDGRFRQDLYYRLNVLQFRIPPLRERLSDIPILVQAGIRRLAPRLGVPAPAVSDAFCARLREERWPGNVRELMNVLERLLVQRRVGTLEPEDLDSILGERGMSLQPAQPSSNPEGAIDERARIRATLIEVGGNVTRAARRLNIPRGTLRYKIERYELQHLIPRD